ncbi:MAG: hypothetical protein BWK80_10510 [Desulfobacteraceae bacterium IS3]|nr:MAG: hypothetical protein BWK80_10510 [Desulfobacteraceae bacterium IS3]
MKTESSRPNILIVDDVPANIRLLQIALTPDYDISACTNGSEAIEIARSLNPDLILLDIMMPEISGYEVCRRLKADSLTSDIPVIFITARNEEQEETKGFELGAVDYITKPFSPGVVRSRVGTHLELKRHRDRLSRANALLKQEIAKQKISIGLSKKLLEMINGTAPRHTDISGGLTLFSHIVSVPCYAEGGDHCFVRNVSGGQGSEVIGQGAVTRTPDPGPRTSAKTIVSIKDQSGHEASCILRSIMTDLIHNVIIKTQPRLFPEAAFSKLNDEICRSALFDSADFFTALTAEIDHETLVLRYVSAGHPPFLLIRGHEIREIPVPGAAGINLPAAVKPGIDYSAGEIQLEAKDRLIFYTDGLTEMPVRKKKKMITAADLKTIAGQVMFGSAPLTAPVVEPVETEPVETPVSEIMERMLAHIADISDEVVIPGSSGGPKNTSADDVTMLGLEIETDLNASEAAWHPADVEALCRNAAMLYEKFEQEWQMRGYGSPMLRLRIVMEEALLNAWIHGNRKNPDKAVSIRWLWGNDFRFEVGDEGEGFDADAVPDPTLKENLMKPCGRGIFFIRYFADQVLWKNGGRRIITYFKKHPDEDSEKSAKTASVF